MKSRERIGEQLDLLDLRTWASAAEKFSPGHIWPRPSEITPTKFTPRFPMRRIGAFRP